MLVRRSVTPHIKFAVTHLYTWVERGTCGSHSGKITLIENGQVQKKPRDVAEIFNNYFTELGISHSLTLTASEFDKHPSVNLIDEIVKDQYQELSFRFQPVSVKYVLNLLSHLNGSKATGVDSIPPRLLKASAPVLAAPMTWLIVLNNLLD